MKLVTVFIFAALLSFSFAAHSLSDPTASAPTPKKHLDTNFDFEDQLVQGKYQYPDEAVTTVEDEKLLKDLLEVRKDFKDRMQQEEFRH
jgi:hypothetical protein